MSGEAKKEIQLEIAHVLFIDIVGYSKLLIDEQRDCLHTLNEVVRETDSFRAVDAAGKLTRLPTGDGMALVFATTPDAPVQCALEISKALKNHPEVRVRMGIHSGPVSAVTDVNDRSNMAGARINMAQRVMDCGDVGHILLSRHVAEDLEQYRRWQSHLHDLGECEVKHGARIHVVNLYTEELGNPDLPDKFKRATPALAPLRVTIREKSAAEIFVNLKGSTPSYRFHEKVEELYLGRWTREPGWPATVHGLPSKLSGGGWFCSLREVGSGTLVMASTVQDVSTLRPGDSVTISGRISHVSQLEDVSLEDAILRGDNVPFP
jgi:class 3 adenylate cyclase